MIIKKSVNLDWLRQLKFYYLTFAKIANKQFGPFQFDDIWLIKMQKNNISRNSSENTTW